MANDLDFPYNATFQAISKAVTITSFNSISISVAAFQNAFNEAGGPAKLKPLSEDASKQIQITKVTVLTRGGHMDVLIADTTLPLTVWPNTGVLQLRSELPIGTGLQYARDHFNIEPVHIKG